MTRRALTLIAALLLLGGFGAFAARPRAPAPRKVHDRGPSGATVEARPDPPAPPQAPTHLPEAPSVPGRDCAPLAAAPMFESRTLAGTFKQKTRVTFPHLISENPQVNREIEAALERDLTARRAAFLGDADRAVVALREAAGGVLLRSMSQDISCEVTLALPSLASFACTSSANLGDDEPTVTHFGYSYRLCASGSPSPLSLGDLCPSGEASKPCVDRIVEEINQALATGPAQAAEVAVGSDSDGLRSFALTNRALRFYLDYAMPDELRADGTIEVPLRALASDLRRDGPLAPLLPRR
jgi:hypothetical protein